MTHRPTGRLQKRSSGWMFGVLAVVLVGATGLSCDSDAQAVFRREATREVGEGVRTIMNGFLDGWIAAVEEAGRGGEVKR